SARRGGRAGRAPSALGPADAGGARRPLDHRRPAARAAEGGVAAWPRRSRARRRSRTRCRRRGGSWAVYAGRRRQETNRLSGQRGNNRPGAKAGRPMSNAALAFEGAGLVLDRYRPLRPLGSGGSGSVWLARDEKTGLDVALKIVAREGKAAARAEREAAAAARLRHPACLRAYAFARDSRHVYIAYEFVPGRTYREAMRAGELNDASAIEACAQICEALAHAHGNGILHRDVKPSNVLLADGERVSARLLDFGLARMAEAETLTAQGDVPGTLAYIAPERLAGDNASEASDVWAVGVMLWESLSGRHPFWQTSMLDTARSIE